MICLLYEYRAPSTKHTLASVKVSVMEHLTQQCSVYHRMKVVHLDIRNKASGRRLRKRSSKTPSLNTTINSSFYYLITLQFKSRELVGNRKG